MIKTTYLGRIFSFKMRERSIYLLIVVYATHAVEWLTNINQSKTARAIFENMIHLTKLFLLIPGPFELLHVSSTVLGLLLPYMGFYLMLHSSIQAFLFLFSLQASSVEIPKWWEPASFSENQSIRWRH